MRHVPPNGLRGAISQKIKSLHSSGELSYAVRVAVGNTALWGIPFGTRPLRSEKHWHFAFTLCGICLREDGQRFELSSAFCSYVG
jgi:hypothetical protein